MRFPAVPITLSCEFRVEFWLVIGLNPLAVGIPLVLFGLGT
jgi:hypothetical protein